MREKGRDSESVREREKVVVGSDSILKILIELLNVEWFECKREEDKKKKVKIFIF